MQPTGPCVTGDARVVTIPARVAVRRGLDSFLTTGIKYAEQAVMIPCVNLAANQSEGFCSGANQRGCIKRRTLKGTLALFGYSLRDWRR
jgi:hypothetical protein